MNKRHELIQELERERTLPDRELAALLESSEADGLLFETADRIRRNIYGDAVYIRGLIEFTNYCKNNCYYCGIRRGNNHATRYRLGREEILSCCEEGYRLGFRTFVLQGGEDPYYTDERVCEIVSEIRRRFPDCAITLSIGEKSKESYQAYYDAGANRYLLRHETADPVHYGKLHPSELNAANRKQCLFDLKEIGYQVGSGFMVGSPYQTTENLIADLRFLQELKPDMIGIGPYITHAETPFAAFPSGSFELTLKPVSYTHLAPLCKQMGHFKIFDTAAAAELYPAGKLCEIKAICFSVCLDADKLRGSAFTADSSIKRRCKNRGKNHVDAVCRSSF